MLRKILIWVIVVIAVIILVFSIATFLLLKNKDNITRIVTNQLNEYLEVPLRTSGINISLFKKLPYVSVEFKDIMLIDQSVNQKKIPLVSLKNGYVMLNIFKIIKGEFEINRLHFEDGYLNLYVGQDGKGNYKILKENGEESNKEFRVNIQDISLQNIRLSYINLPNNLKIQTLIKNAKISGDISNKQTLIKIKSSQYIDNISRGKIKYVKEGNALFNLELNKKGDIITISEGNFRVNRQFAETSGTMDLSTGNMNIILNGNNLRFDSDENIFNLDESITGFTRITGTVATRVKISGNYRGKNQLNLQAAFNLGNGLLVFKNQRLKYSLQYFKGSFKSGKKGLNETFVIDDFFFTGNGDTVRGGFMIADFENPRLSAGATASVNTAHINPFIGGQKNIVFNGGRAKLKWKTRAIHLGDKELWKSFIRQTENSGIQTTNVSLSLPMLGKEVSGLNSDLALNSSVTINKMAFSLPGSDFTLDGKISNLLDLLEKKNTWIELRTYSEKLDLMQFIAVPEQNSQGQNNWPRYLYIKSETYVETLTINKVNYSKAKATVSYKPGLATLNLYNTNVFGGNFKGNCALEMPVGDQMKLAIIAETKEVDINQMFRAYKEFGQSFITSKNLKGKLDCNVNYKSGITNDFSIDSRSILCNAGITINNGELMDHEPMYSLSGYVKLEELKHIYFADLTNEIFIKDECITIPGMQINSSAMDIEISGRHYFNNQFEYMMNIYLSDLLAKKVTRNKENENEFTYTRHNNNKHFKIPLVLKGDTADFQVEINKKQARENFSVSVKKEKQEIKTALQKEFELFNKEKADSSEIAVSNEFKFNFEENSEPEKIAPDEQQKIQKTDKSKLQFEWEDE